MPIEPYMLGDGKDRTRKAKRQEIKGAQLLCGRKQPASGAFPGRKGDVKTDDFLIDWKGAKMVFGLSKGVVTKITKEALGADRVPALVVQFDDMPAGVADKWVVIEMETFERLIRSQ